MRHHNFDILILVTHLIIFLLLIFMQDYDHNVQPLKVYDSEFTPKKSKWYKTLNKYSWNIFDLILFYNAFFFIHCSPFHIFHIIGCYKMYITLNLVGIYMLFCKNRNSVFSSVFAWAWIRRWTEPPLETFQITFSLNRWRKKKMCR